MNKMVKNTIIFVGGVVVGSVACGTKLIKFAVEDQDIREGIVNKISKVLDKHLFGDSKKRTRKVSYQTYYNNRYRDDITPFRYDDILFETRTEAEKVLSDMKGVIIDYGCVTVADYYDLTGNQAPFGSGKLGWKTLKDAKIRLHGNLRDYVIELPKPVSFK